MKKDTKANEGRRKIDMTQFAAGNLPLLDADAGFEAKVDYYFHQKNWSTIDITNALFKTHRIDWVSGVPKSPAWYSFHQRVCDTLGIPAGDV